MTRLRYRPGDTVTAVMDDEAGNRVTATVPILCVDQLGCGCTRLDCERPNPNGPPGRVHLHTGGCARHPDELTAA